MKECLEITFICLVRHGETDWNLSGRLQGRTDIPLNNTGVIQAKECSQLLKGTHWDVIITSPLKRARETAEIISKDQNIIPVQMKDFLERSFGDAEGMTVQERLSAFPKRNYPRQETREDLNKRIISGINKINLEYHNERVLLVAHGAVINTILANFSNGEIGSGKTKLINGCISNIEFTQDEWKINDYNQVKHLSHYSEEGRI